MSGERAEGTALVFNNIDIWMDSYDDVFSDFDPGPYTKRSISEDFIAEVLRREKDAKGEIQLRLSVPEALRSVRNEAIIKKRLKDYFTKMEKHYWSEARKERDKGMLYFIWGLALLTLIITLQTFMNAYIHVQVLNAVLAPLGWFGMWEGTHHLLEGPKSLNAQKQAYKKLSNAKYEFYSEEALVNLVREAEEARKLTGED